MKRKDTLKSSLIPGGLHGQFVARIEKRLDVDLLGLGASETRRNSTLRALHSAMPSRIQN